MGRHAVAGPRRLAHPAPLVPAAGPGAHHVHTSTIPFRRGAALRTRLRRHLDGNLGRLVPTGLRSSQRINGIPRSRPQAGRNRLQTLPNMVTLQAAPTKNKPTTILTLNPAAVSVHQQPHSATRLGTQNATVPQHVLFRREALVPVVLFLRQ